MTAPRFAVIGLAGMLACQAQSHRADSATACLRYGPETVSVRGRLVRLTFPGPPNYQDTLRGDEPETGFYLQVRPAICVRGGRDEELGDAHAGVDSIQLVLDSLGYAALRPALGTTIELRGSLLPEQSGHHHAPVLLEVAKPVRVAP